MQVEVEKLIRLLVIEEGLHKAEQITSSLRAAGVQVRAEFAEDTAGMCEMLENKTLDLVLFSIDLPEFTLKQAQLLIQESGRHVALVAMTRDLSSEVLVQSIQDGAQDVVSLKNLDHLYLVIKREAFCLSLWRKAARTELELQESEKRCQSLLANSMDAVAYVHEGMYIYANAVYLELFGYAEFEAIEGTPIIDMVDSSQQSQLKTLLRDINKARNEIDKLDLKLIQSNGDMVPATVEFSKTNYDGEPCILVLVRSVIDTTELEEQITYLHQHDLVTGLYNRQNFMDKLKSSITQAMNGIHQSAVVYFAIDNFQSIRDMVGISGCDILIGDIAKLISENVPEGQIVARFGAASYACLGIVEEKSLINEFATGILSLVEERVFEIGDQSISATCSASICFVDENSPNNANRIIARAEKTCDQIQNRGGNKSRTYIPKADDMTRKEADGVTTDLIKDALSNNRIAGLYQPIVSIKAASGERFTSSLEISAEDGTKFNDKNYRRAAERSGTAQTLDRWIILHAIKKIAEINKSFRKVEIFIPLGVGSVLDESLAPWVSESLARAGVTGEQLVFMVNEGHAVNHLKTAKTLFSGLKEINCQLGLDDFGTGINPFQLIRHFHADYVRINVAYMDNLARNEDNQESIREFASHAASMNIRSITPGVEDAAILSVLWTLGVDFVQGEFLQRPEPVLNYDFSSLTG
ncbi:MAG: EAL domain-containing protein [Gammaproteobacteria bacterium]|nr:EAL domain-containing protein [Gammaproteobacteria bacterium]